MVSLAKFKEQAAALSVEQRASLASFLLHTLPDTDYDVSDEEVAERLRQMKSGDVTAVSMEELREGVFDQRARFSPCVDDTELHISGLFQPTPLAPMKPSHPSQHPTCRCFHGFRIMAAALLLGAAPAFAQDETKAPEEEVKKVGSYVFKPIEIRSSPFGMYEGRFLFINKESSPVRIFGSDEPLDGKFNPMYLEYQMLKGGKWEKIPVGYCGTGAQDFAMLPGKEYEFVTSLDYFDEQDTPLTGKIGANGFWSEPFVLDWKKDRKEGKFELAKKENSEKARALFAKAGFKKELLEGDDFCSRLLQAMMKETSVKGTAASFHPFAGKLEVCPWIQLNGSIRIDFTSDEVRNYDTEYRGWFVLSPRKFRPEWFRKAVKQHVEAGKWGEGVEMELNDGSSFDSPFYLCIKYVPFDHAKRPTNEESEKLFRNMLAAMDGWLK